MTQGEVLSVMQDAIYTVIIASAPMLLVAIVIGLIISIFQATTQINEQTLTFTPKFIGILLSLLIFGSFIMSALTGFVTRLFSSINNIVG